MNIKLILNLIILINTTAFSWMARDYKEHVVVDSKYCENIHEIAKSGTTSNCVDSIKNKGNFKFVGRAGWLTDELEILKSEEIKKIETTSTVNEVNVNRDVEVRKAKALERQADALEDISIVSKINLTISLIVGVFVIMTLK